MFQKLIPLVLLGLLSGGDQTPLASFAVVGVYMDESRANDHNMHVVGTWALSIKLPPNSTIAQIQTASQAECQKTARSGWRCAEMGQRNVSDGKHPCGVVALGVYRHKDEDGVWRPYTLWPLKFGFDSAASAEQWGHDELKRLPVENDNDPLVREINVSTVCVVPTS